MQLQLSCAPVANVPSLGDRVDDNVRGSAHVRGPLDKTDDQYQSVLNLRIMRLVLRTD